MPALTLGILTDCIPREQSGRLFWPESAYAHLSQVIPPDASLVWFHPLDVDMTRRQVFGWRYIQSRTIWAKTHCELPTIIYNRIARRSTERLTAFHRLFHHLNRQSVVFNPRFLDKSEVHFALSDSDLSRHWPDSVVCTRAQDALPILKRFDDVYLKPIHGSLGQGIVRIVRHHRRFEYWRTIEGDVRPLHGMLPERIVTHALISWFRKSPFLIQETILRSTYDGRPFDLRVLMQKNAHDTWEMTGVAGRVSTHEGITTHATRGGFKVSYDQLTQCVSHLPSQSEIDSLCHRALEALRDYAELDLFEASLDVAVDADGHPYILEINSKPFPFDEKDIQQKAARTLFKYARAKQGLTPKRPVLRG